MTPTVALTRDNVTPTLERYAVEMRRALPEVAVRYMRGVTRRVLAITPPGNAGTQGASQTLGMDAYNAGRARIARQMQAVLIPVRLKHKRKERWPDVAGLYRSQLKSNGGRMRLANYTGQKFYVDVRKFREVLRDRQGRVGRMASGWGAAAVGLKVALPAWVSRHGTTRGRLVQDLGGPKIKMIVTNFAPEATGPIRAEMVRRIPYATAYQRAGMEREIEVAGLSAAGRAGLKVRRR
jgi:hypothetical protein